jgi:hypothetical protein
MGSARIWPSSATPSTPPKKPERKRGPKPDVENHAKVAALVRRYDDDWILDDNLQESARSLTNCMCRFPRSGRAGAQDWQRLDAHPIYWLETFVDTSRFRGTCYRAANWQVIGTTMGRGHRAPRFEQTRPVKQMLGLPLQS